MIQISSGLIVPVADCIVAMTISPISYVFLQCNVALTLHPSRCAIYVLFL